MRPVNLLPPEERRGKGAGAKNPVTYAIVGFLVFVLVAVSTIALFNKKINDNQVQVDALQSQIDTAQAEANSLTSFTSFQQIHDTRVATIDSLAKSRFDWERVMRELSIVLPDGVYLTNLTGTVTPTASVTNGAGLQARASIPGPALEMTGCATNQRTVARLIAAMHDIDGVGRVLVSNSSKTEPAAAVDGGSAAPVDTSATGCATQSTYPTFELVAAFDGVPTADTTATIDPATGVPAVAPTTATAPATTPVTPGATTTAPTTATDPTATTATTPTTTTPADGGVAAATAQNTAQQGEVAGASDSANAAAQIPSGGKK